LEWLERGPCARRGWCCKVTRSADHACARPGSTGVGCKVPETRRRHTSYPRGSHAAGQDDSSEEAGHPSPPHMVVSRPHGVLTCRRQGHTHRLTERGRPRFLCRCGFPWLRAQQAPTTRCPVHLRHAARLCFCLLRCCLRRAGAACPARRAGRQPTPHSRAARRSRRARHRPCPIDG
jgi:hypothetical protein